MIRDLWALMEIHMNNTDSPLGGWFNPILIVVCSVLFLLLGINTLLSAYMLKNPLEFIMTFFSASLIILISAVGIIFSAFRIYRKLHPSGAEKGLIDET